jgi:hypothetical protein
MAEHRSLLKTAMIVLTANVVIQLLAGVMAGLGEDWMRMSLFLFGAVLSVFFATTGLVMMSLKDRLAQLENRLHIDRTEIPAGTRRIGAGVGIFSVLSVAACMSLSIVAGFRGDWLRQGLYLAACAITVIVCTGILAALGIKTRFSNLEREPADEPASSPQL